jgi:hypothetical protein
MQKFDAPNSFMPIPKRRLPYAVFRMLQLSRYPEQSEMRNVHALLVYIASWSNNNMVLLAGRHDRY